MIVTLELAATGRVLTKNVAAVCPLTTVTDTGTLAGPDPTERRTLTPALGAGPVRVTFPVVLTPPTTVCGATVTLRSAAGSTLTATLCEDVPIDPVIVEVTWLATGNDLMIKVADVFFAGIVTETPTVAAEGRLLTNLTTTPPVGAGPVIVTVPVEIVPPGMLEGFAEIDAKMAGSIPSVVDCVSFPKVAVTVTEWPVVTETVGTENVMEDNPAGTLTQAGTLAYVELLIERLTRIPPDGAGPFRVTVPVAVVPPATELGEKLMPISAVG